MTFMDIQNELIAYRFKAAERANTKRWINTAEAKVWNGADWPWRKVTPTALAVLSGVQTPVMPSDYANPTGLYDDLGNELPYINEWEFQAVNQQQVARATSGRPGAYTIINGQIILSPSPNQNYTFTFGYERKPVHFNGSGTVTAGVMSADDDYPIYNAQWHYILVLGAMAVGLKIQNDPTYDAIEQEFALMLQAMADEETPPDRNENLQYGRDPLGSWI